MSEPSRPAEPSVSSPIEVIGVDRHELTAASLSAYPVVERRIEVVCASGERTVDDWRGVPVESILAAHVPGETTHVLVESTDGYRVCVDAEAALDGLLAFARGGEALAAVADHETRFLSRSVGGPRTVKDVARLEAISLDADDDPEAYEDLQL